MTPFSHSKSFLALSLSAAMCLSSGTALAQASGDGRVGPLIVDDLALNDTLQALNDHIQDKQIQDQMFAALTEERTLDFATVAVATAAAPRIEETLDVAAFGYSVDGDHALNEGLDLFNTELSLRGDDLFIQVARAETSKNDAFQVAAASAGIDAKMRRRRLELADANDGFGDPVSSDASLVRSIIALNDMMDHRDAREIMLAAALPPVKSGSFDTIMVAMAYSY